MDTASIYDHNQLVRRKQKIDGTLIHGNYFKVIVNHVPGSDATADVKKSTVLWPLIGVRSGGSGGALAPLEFGQLVIFRAI